MPGAFRAFVAVSSFALGTWVSAGRPSASSLAAQGSASAVRAFTPPPIDTPPVTPEVGTLGTRTVRWNPQGTLQRAWLLAEGPVHTPGDGRRVITFTFDDGPSPLTTPAVLDVLERYHVRATFFVIGKYLEGSDPWAVANRQIAQRVVAAGHFIGNHTRDHRHLTEVARAEAVAQVDEGARLIQQTTGIAPKFFRPPFGDLSRFLERRLHDEGTEVVLWNAEADDMRHDEVETVVEALKLRIDYTGGGVVLLHDVRRNTAVVLGRILDWLTRQRFDPLHPSARSYEVVDLVEFMNRTVASPQPFSDRYQLEGVRREAWYRTYPARRARAVASPSSQP